MDKTTQNQRGIINEYFYEKFIKSISPTPLPNTHKMRKSAFNQALLLGDFLLLITLFFIYQNYFSTAINTIILLMFLLTNITLFFIGMVKHKSLMKWTSIGSFGVLLTVFSGLFGTSIFQKPIVENTIRIASYNLNYLRSVFVPQEKKTAKSFDSFEKFGTSE